jgi:hypothetical protein
MAATNAVATIAAGMSFFIGNPLSRRFTWVRRPLLRNRFCSQGLKQRRAAREAPRT